MAESVAYFAIKSIGMSTCGGRKPQTLMDAARHNLREIQAEQGASSHIDASRIKHNEVLFGPLTAKEVQAQAGALLALVDTTKLKRDHVQAVEAVFSLPSGARVAPKEYFDRCLAWITSALPMPLLLATVHHDEAEQHMHVLMLPTKDGKHIGGALIDRAKLRALRESFFNTVAGPAGLKRQGAKMAGTVKRLAVTAVLKACEAQGLPQKVGDMWPVLKGAIERDPTESVQALKISDAAIRATSKEALNPIALAPSPIALYEQDQKTQGLSCVALLHQTTSPSPQTQANHLLEPKDSDKNKVLMSQNTEDADASPKAIDTMEALWAAVGCRSAWTTIKPPPAPSITPPTNLTLRLEVARAAMEKATLTRKVVPVELAQMVRALVPLERDDSDGVVRVRDEDAHDLSAWDY